MQRKKNGPVQLKDAQEKITPDQYQNFLQQLRLEEIFISQIKVKRPYDVSVVSEEIPKIQIDLQSNFTNLQNFNKTYGSNVYKIKVKSGRKNLLSAEIEITAEYSYDSIPFDDTYFTIFDDISMQMMLFPYARLLINRILTDSGLGLLTLPMRKIFIEKKKEE